MKPYLSRLLMLLIAVIFITQSCSKKGNSNPTPQDTKVTVVSIDVNEGVSGTPVTITGTNFGSNISENLVFFNGNPATVKSATTSQLKVLVPLGAGTGNITVTVNGNTATGPIFTYKLSLIVSTFAGNSSGIPSDGTGALAGFLYPGGITTDETGNFYIADMHDHLIRKMTSLGVVTTIAGNPTQSGSLDGTGSSATFNWPWDVAVDAAGNIYVADIQNINLRKITPQGVVTTSTDSNLANPNSVAIDKTGNLYLTDPVHNMIKKVTSAGVVTILAGNGTRGSDNGPSSTASFNAPTGIAVDGSGNVYVSDNGNMIRKVTPAGIVSTFAGVGINGTTAVQGFYNPIGLAVDKDGNVFVADSGNNLIKKITPAGVVSTFAGSGIPGLVNGSAALATFNTPSDICFDSSGNMYVTDSGSNTIRKIALQ